MKIDRTNYPHISKEDMVAFVQQLKPMELDIFTEVLADKYEEENLKAKEAYRRIGEMKVLTSEISLALRRAQNELEEIDESATKLQSLLSGNENKKNNGPA